MRVMLLLVLSMFLFFGCADFTRTSRKCRNLCSDTQENNVGAKFMWSDVERTFGKCTCISREGGTKIIYMKTRRASQ